MRPGQNQWLLRLRSSNGQTRLCPFTAEVRVVLSQPGLDLGQRSPCAAMSLRLMAQSATCGPGRGGTRRLRPNHGAPFMGGVADLRPDFPPAAGRVPGVVSARCAAFSSSPICAATTAVGTFFRPECGRHVVTASRPAQAAVRAWRRSRNSVLFRSASRSLPLKLSTKAFWVGFPGAMACQSLRCSGTRPGSPSK